MIADLVDRVRVYLTDPSPALTPIVTAAREVAATPPSWAPLSAFRRDGDPVD